MKRAGLAVALFLVGCAAPGPNLEHYLEEPTPLRLVEVLSGRGDEERAALLSQALTARHINHTAEPFSLDGVEGINLVAEIGTGPPLYLVTAHMDRAPNSPGANDNASCVAALVDAYERIRAAGDPKNATLRFLFTGGEKSSLAGSRSHAAQADVRHIQGILTLDLCGIGDGAVAWGIEKSTVNSKLFKVFKEAAAEVGLPIGLHGLTARFVNDHDSFTIRNIPAFAVNMAPVQDIPLVLEILDNPNHPKWIRRSQRPPPFRTYQTRADRPESLDPASLDRTARLVAAFARRL